MSGIASQRKPVEEIIKKHNQFFYSLAEITNIHVYGLSLSEVDIPYLKHILLIVKSAKWEFSDYKAFNSAKIKCFCKNNDIHGYDIIELENIIGDYPSDCVNRKLRDFSRSFFIYILTL